VEAEVARRKKRALVNFILMQLDPKRIVTTVVDACGFLSKTIFWSGWEEYVSLGLLEVRGGRHAQMFLAGNPTAGVWRGKLWKIIGVQHYFKAQSPN
jgi:hypothetical protein